MNGMDLLATVKVYFVFGCNILYITQINCDWEGKRIQLNRKGYGWRRRLTFCERHHRWQTLWPSYLKEIHRLLVERFTGQQLRQGWSTTCRARGNWWKGTTPAALRRARVWDNQLSRGPSARQVVVHESTTWTTFLWHVHYSVVPAL